MGAKDNEQLKGLINEGDLITADGIGLIYASRIKKKPLKERVTGYYLTIKLLDIANENNYSVYFLGWEDGVAKSSSRKYKKTYQILEWQVIIMDILKVPIMVTRTMKKRLKVINDINSSNPDIIFVGLGFPKQENWIDTNKGKY